MGAKKVAFIDIAHCLNVHVFIIWEFIRRFGYEDGVSKDKYGRGYVGAAECTQWIDELASYVKAQDFSYKQEINKRQYLIRDEERLAEEKKAEQDVRRVYFISWDGKIGRHTYFKDNTSQTFFWQTDGTRWKLHQPDTLRGVPVVLLTL